MTHDLPNHSPRRHRAERAMLRSALLIGGLAAVGALSSCGGETANVDVPVVAVELGQYTISPAELVVPAGTVELAVTNTDVMVHNLVVAGRGTRNLAPGETQSLEVTVAPGSYRMWCDIPGHAQMGQTGTLFAAESTPASSRP